MTKIKEILEKCFNLKIFVCIKDGMVFTIPFTIIGSTFLVLSQLKSLLETLELFFGKIVNYSFNSIGLIACLGIAYSYNKKIGIFYQWLQFYLFI